MKLHNDGKLINNQKKSHINNNTYFQSLLSLNFALEEDGVLQGMRRTEVGMIIGQPEAMFISLRGL